MTALAMNDRIAAPAHVAGSFRDPGSRVFLREGRVLRAVDAQTLENFRRLANQPFFAEFRRRGLVVETSEAEVADRAHFSDWAGVLEHQRIPFVSYPYEWPFSMLKQAALLQLQLIEESIENGWTLKDATAFNVQWVGAKPIFIDLPSFEPRPDGEPWLGYRQFCASFLIPLMLKAHLEIDYAPLLRSQLDGISAREAAKMFYGLKRAKPGVLSHIVLPSRIENQIAERERGRVPVARRVGRRHSLAMVLGLVQSMKRLVQRLTIKGGQSDWSEYDRTHSYSDSELNAKIEFVGKWAGNAKRRFVWDIGCNTGTFSRVCEPFADYVIAVDGDHNAVESLYLKEASQQGSKILPLVMDLANLSPNQGWAGAERAAFDAREKPALVLALALVHHVRLSANVPLEMFLDWLRSLGASLIIEFVEREDEMVVKLLTNKKERYEDYNRENFLKQVKQRYRIVDSRPLKGNHRELFYLEPR